MKLLCNKHQIEGQYHRKGIPSAGRTLYYDYVDHAWKNRLVSCSQGLSKDQSLRSRKEVSLTNTTSLKALREKFANMASHVRRETILKEIDGITGE